MKQAVFIFYSLVLSGCSWFSPAKKEVEILPPPKITHVSRQKPKQIKRELGSLWSEDSSWNQIYSPTQTRSPGDIITVKLDKKFISKLELAVKRPELEEEPKKDDKDKKKDKKSPEPEATAENMNANSEGAGGGRSPASTTASAPKLPDIVEVTIVEVLPRGAYRVAANQGFKPTVDAPYVYIQGMVRDREIGEDNSVSSNSLLDLKFESINRDMKVTTESGGEES